MTIKVEKIGNVVVLRLHRPEKRNALNTELMNALVGIAVARPRP